MRVEMFTFLLAGLICLGGALGVVLFRNTVHNALSLVATLFGVAVLFIAQEAYFLAAVQVIVYAGAIVILFLFVIMLLGVDRADQMGVDPIVGQRTAAVVFGVAILGLSLVALLSGPEVVTGTPA
ncbi:MAG: NADH-quinone oxidoreductase subunit J, partial [Microthrixaceae bacterium]